MIFRTRVTNLPRMTIRPWVVRELPNQSARRGVKAKLWGSPPAGRLGGLFDSRPGDSRMIKSAADVSRNLEWWKANTDRSVFPKCIGKTESLRSFWLRSSGICVISSLTPSTIKTESTGVWQRGLSPFAKWIVQNRPFVLIRPITLSASTEKSASLGSILIRSSRLIACLWRTSSNISLARNARKIAFSA